jgi:hypothetical protein
MVSISEMTRDSSVPDFTAVPASVSRGEKLRIAVNSVFVSKTLQILRLYSYNTEILDTIASGVCAGIDRCGSSDGDNEKSRNMPQE